MAKPEDTGLDTTLLLMAQYKKALLTLDDVAAVFHIAPGTLLNRIYAGTAPVQMWKPDGSREYVAHIADVAAAIDRARARALKAAPNVA